MITSSVFAVVVNSSEYSIASDRYCRVASASLLCAMSLTCLH